MSIAVVSCYSQADHTSDDSLLDKLWQQIIATDATYVHQKSFRHISALQRQLYLRRRHQLAHSNSHNQPITSDIKCPDNFPSSFANLRSEYLIKRSSLLAAKYGELSQNPCASRKATGVDTPESLSQLNVILDRYQRDDLLSARRSSYSLSSSSSFSQRQLLRKVKNEVSVSDLYAFSGIETIFDHHKDSITRIRFAHNESTRLAVASSDRAVSICRILPPSSSSSSDEEETTTSDAPNTNNIVWLRPSHPGAGAVMDIAWSSSNDFLISASLDGCLCLWDVQSLALARHFPAADLTTGGILACEFHPLNNNYLAIADTNGMVQVVNMSTGRVVNEGRDQLHPVRRTRSKPVKSCRSREDLLNYLGRGCVTAIAFDTASGTCLWAGTDHGLIQSYVCSSETGKLVRARRLQLNPASIPESASTENSSYLRNSQALVPHSLTRVQPQRTKSSWFTSNGKPNSTPVSLPCVTSLTSRSWLSQGDSSTYLLANAAGLGLLLFLVVNSDGQLTFHRQFDVVHSPITVPPTSNFGLHLLRSCFAPLISFGSSSCVVSGSEDGNVYVFEVIASESESASSNCVTYFQGHMGSVVDVALSWDESVLASADEAGNVIVWRRQSHSN